MNRLALCSVVIASLAATAAAQPAPSGPTAPAPGEPPNEQAPTPPSEAPPSEAPPSEAQPSEDQPSEDPPPAEQHPPTGGAAPPSNEVPTPGAPAGPAPGAMAPATTDAPPPAPSSPASSPATPDGSAVPDAATSEAGPAQGSPAGATPVPPGSNQSPTAGPATGVTSHASGGSAEGAGPKHVGGTPSGHSAEKSDDDAQPASAKGQNRPNRTSMLAQGIAAGGGGGALQYRLMLPWGHSTTAPTFSKAAGRTYNPTYQWNFSPTLIWFLEPTTMLFAWQGMSVELTDSDSSSRPQQVLFSDPQLAFQHQIGTVPIAEGHSLLGFVTGGAALPLSLASQAATRIVSFNGGGMLAWAMSDVLNTLFIQAGVQFTGNINSSQAAVYDGRYPCTTLGGFAAADCRAGVNANSVWATQFSLTGQLIATQSLWTTLGVSFTTSRNYGWEPTTVEVDAGKAELGPSKHVQFGRYGLIARVNYFPVPFINLSLTVSNNFAQVKTGSYRAPLNAQDIFIDFVAIVYLDGHKSSDE